MQNSNNRAFTLLELSIVLLIISVVMGGIMVLFNQSLEQQQVQETQTKMAAIQKALSDYRLAFLRIPCPADATQAMDATSSNYYGVEAANNGTCTGGTPAANFSIAASTFTGSTTNASAVVTSVSSTTGLSIGTVVSGTGITSGTTIASIDSATQITLDTAATATNAGITISRNTVVGGMVPTKTLQLPDDYAIDGWGRRIMYMVDVNLTASAGFATVPVTDSATNRITINDSTGAARTTSAVYALISFGKNGHGGYNRSGSSTRLANYISADADELTNCHCSSAAAATAFSSTFVQKPISTGTFDDLVLYATRADLRAPYE
jgi:prepilin-type N-terminal cleavage/methylation domain-containing protein